MWDLLEWAVVGLVMLVPPMLALSIPGPAERQRRRVDRQVRTQRGRVLEGAEELCRRAAEGERWT